MAVFERTFTISGSDVDPHDRMRVDALAVMLQESAAHHADTWGMSIPALMAAGRTWVLARLAIELEGQRPAWKDEVVVETWSSGFRGHIAGREYIVRRKGSDTVIARAASGWFVLDLASRRPVRLAEYEGRDEPGSERLSGVALEAKIALPSSEARELPSRSGRATSTSTDTSTTPATPPGSTKPSRPRSSPRTACAGSRSTTSERPGTPEW